VDPNAWAILGPLPVSHFVVKAAARRVLLMELWAEDPEFSVIHGHRPRLWPGVAGSGGLLAMEPLLRSGGSMPQVLLMRRMPSCVV
jgi:hypothetical protein